MKMIGYFIVDSFSKDKDSQGFETGINVSVKYDMNLKGFLYLPPHLRKSQCEISVGSEVFGVMDDTTGLGVAMFGVDCDINFKNQSDYEFTKTLTVDGDVTCVKGDIKAKVGDVIATSISLKNHIHQITSIPPQDCAIIVASASSGTPTPLTLTYTITPQ